MTKQQHTFEEHIAHTDLGKLLAKLEPTNKKQDPNVDNVYQDAMNAARDVHAHLTAERVGVSDGVSAERAQRLEHAVATLLAATPQNGGGLSRKHAHDLVASFVEGIASGVTCIVVGDGTQGPKQQEQSGGAKQVPGEDVEHRTAPDTRRDNDGMPGHRWTKEVRSVPGTGESHKSAPNVGVSGNINGGSSSHTGNINAERATSKKTQLG